MSHNITVEGGTSVRLKTAGKYCDRDIVVKSSGVEPDYYEGTYEVTPNTKQQVLFTEQKTLQENIIVNSVPYAEVSNTSNGTTITIGK